MNMREAMTLIELKSSVGQLTLNQAIEHLLTKGYGPVGEGSWGYVLHKAGAPYCVKLYEVKDLGYTKFYRYCQARQNDRHLPKIFGIGKFMDNFVAVRLELLLEDYAIKKRGVRLYQMADLIQRYCDHPEHREPDAPLRAAIAQQIPATLMRTVDNLLAAFPGSSWDIGAVNNLMQRRDGTPVITDPFYGR